MRNSATGAVALVGAFALGIATTSHAQHAHQAFAACGYRAASGARRVPLRDHDGERRRPGVFRPRHSLALRLQPRRSRALLSSRGRARPPSADAVLGRRACRSGRTTTTWPSMRRARRRPTTRSRAPSSAQPTPASASATTLPLSRSAIRRRSPRRTGSASIASTAKQCARWWRSIPTISMPPRCSPKA